MQAAPASDGERWSESIPSQDSRTTSFHTTDLHTSRTQPRRQGNLLPRHRRANTTSQITTRLYQSSCYLPTTLPTSTTTSETQSTRTPPRCSSQSFHERLYHQHNASRTDRLHGRETQRSRSAGFGEYPSFHRARRSGGDLWTGNLACAYGCAG